MADQAINALPTKDTPESTDQLLVIGEAEEKLIDYDKLADAILNKLTSKKFEMDTGTQTIMEAIASLNGNTTFENRVEKTNTADGESITVSVNVPKTGWYLVMFSVCQCGASEISKIGASWNVSGSGINGTARDRLNIPISTVWDNANAVSTLLMLYEGENNYKFTNDTGVATNSIYGSVALVKAIKL